MAEEIIFTPEEISVIDKNLRHIVFDWAKHLISHIILSAKKKGVSRVFINTPETLDSGANDDKTAYFYESLPSRLGFTKTQVNLRGKGDEPMWVMDINKALTAKTFSDFIKLAQVERTFTIDDVPKKYQGAVLSMIGRKPQYSKEELLKVIDILNKKEKNVKEITPVFMYDAKSKSWTGAQRFDKSISEVVVLQKIPPQTQNAIETNPVLSKFWAFLLSKNNHFGADVIGFALISMINNDNWVINEIQTDSIQHYLNVRAKYYKRERFECLICF